MLSYIQRSALLTIATISIIKAIMIMRLMAFRIMPAIAMPRPAPSRLPADTIPHMDRIRPGIAKKPMNITQFRIPIIMPDMARPLTGGLFCMLIWFAFMPLFICPCAPHWVWVWKGCGPIAPPIVLGELLVAPADPTLALVPQELQNAAPFKLLPHCTQKLIPILYLKSSWDVNEYAFNSCVFLDAFAEGAHTECFSEVVAGEHNVDFTLLRAVVGGVFALAR